MSFLYMMDVLYLEETLFNLVVAFFEKVSSISRPIELLPAFSAAIKVVPLPAKGSKTVSPTKLNIRTSLYANSSGKGAG